MDHVGSSLKLISVASHIGLLLLCFELIFTGYRAIKVDLHSSARKVFTTENFEITKQRKVAE